MKPHGFWVFETALVNCIVKRSLEHDVAKLFLKSDFEKLTNKMELRALRRIISILSLQLVSFGLVAVPDFFYKSVKGISGSSWLQLVCFIHFWSGLWWAHVAQNSNMKNSKQIGNYILVFTTKLSLLVGHFTTTWSYCPLWNKPCSFKLKCQIGLNPNATAIFVGVR